MLHQPHRFEGGRVADEAGNDMPVDVRKLVAEEFVVDLFGSIDLGKGFGYEVHFLYQLSPFRGSEMKQLCRMMFEHHNGPAGKELIFVEIGARQPEVGDEMVGFWPASLAGFASWICHG